MKIDAKWDLAWSYFGSILHQHGYALAPRLGQLGSLRSAIWPPAADPFSPQPCESFAPLSLWLGVFGAVRSCQAAQASHVYPTSLSCRLRAFIGASMLTNEKLTLNLSRHTTQILKRSRSGHLDSEELRKDPRNHTLPLLDVLPSRRVDFTRDAYLGVQC